MRVCRYVCGVCLSVCVESVTCMRLWCRHWRWNYKIGLVAHVGGLCAKGNYSWGWLGAFVFECRQCSCVLVCVRV